MKKLVVLIMALALTAIALPVFASNVTASGELTYGFVTQGSASTTAEGFSNAQLNLAASVDKNNSVNLGLTIPEASLYPLGSGFSWNASNTPQIALGGIVQHFYLQSDLGAILNLGTVDPVLYAGNGTATLPGYSVTDYGNENISGLGIGGEGAGLTGNETDTYNYIAVNTVVAKDWNVLVGVGPSAFAGSNVQAVAGLYGTIGPVSVEAGYSGAGGAKIGDGTVMAGALVAYPVMSNMTVSGTAQVVNSLASGATNTYAVGAKVDYKSGFEADAAFSLVGNYGNTSGLLKSDWNVDFMPISNAGLYVAGVLNYTKNALSLFDTAEFGGWYGFGPAKVYVGYLTGQQGNAAQIAANEAFGVPNLHAAVGGQSGVFVTADLTF